MEEIVDGKLPFWYVGSPNTTLARVVFTVKLHQRHFSHNSTNNEYHSGKSGLQAAGTSKDLGSIYVIEVMQSSFLKVICPSLDLGRNFSKSIRAFLFIRTDRKEEKKKKVINI